MPKNLQQYQKHAAEQFLQLVVAGHIDEAYQTHVDMNGKHHNAYFPAGFPELKKAMAENQAQMPDKKLIIKLVIGDGNLVAVYSHLIPKAGEKGVAVVHIFRFEGEKIVEMWDCGQPVPADSPNKDG